MQFSLIVNIVSLLVVFIGISMLVPAAVGLYYMETDVYSTALAAAVTLGVGGLLYFATSLNKKRSSLSHREGFLIVAFGWIAVTFFGALPYYFFAHFPVESTRIVERVPFIETQEYVPKNEICESSVNLGTKAFCSFTNTMFESVSGFTTTGGTVLGKGLWEYETRKKEEEMPHGIMVWRSMTQWLGGMGIVVLAIAVLPLLGVGGMDLFRAEVPGPTTERIMPRVRETSKQLWKVYVMLTVFTVLLLLGAGLTPFMAINHAFTTLSTGGFSPLVASVGQLGNPAAEVVITVMMFFGGVSFTLHFVLLMQRKFLFFRDTEFQVYSAIVIGTILIVSSALWVAGGPFLETLRLAAFQVVSIITTTGYSSTDYEQWRSVAPVAAIALLGMFFIGGCAGSTSGGIKCIRIWLLMKQAYRDLVKQIHPHAVIHIKVAKKVVDESILRSLTAFVTLYFLLFGLGVLIISVSGEDMVTAITTSISCIGNVGPGFGGIGPMENFDHFSDLVKWVCIALMLLGRLEVYTFLILFLPTFWKS